MIIDIAVKYIIKSFTISTFRNFYRRYNFVLATMADAEEKAKAEKLAAAKKRVCVPFCWFRARGFGAHLLT